MKIHKYSALILNYHIGRAESIPLSIIFAFQNLPQFFFLICVLLLFSIFLILKKFFSIMLKNRNRELLFIDFPVFL